MIVTFVKWEKVRKVPFSPSTSFSTECFELIHSNVWGIAPTLSHANYKYFVTFIDYYGRFTWVYFLHYKADVVNVFKIFLAYVENQFSKCIKILRSDSEGEYTSTEFQKFLQQKGILSQKTCPYTPQQNGLAERKNRHPLDVTRSLLLESSVPPRFWAEALYIAVYLINRLPFSFLGRRFLHGCLSYKSTALLVFGQKLSPRLSIL